MKAFSEPPELVLAAHRVPGLSETGFLNRFSVPHLRFSVKGNLESKKFLREYYLYINGFLRDE